MSFMIQSLFITECFSNVNMNKNVKYIVSNPAPGQIGREFSFRGEYFEVYSLPIRLRYSEVYWKPLDPVSLPADIIARFFNSTMAVTGFEIAYYTGNLSVRLIYCVPTIKRAKTYPCRAISLTIITMSVTFIPPKPHTRLTHMACLRVLLWGMEKCLNILPYWIMI